MDDLGIYKNFIGNTVGKHIGVGSIRVGEAMALPITCLFIANNIRTPNCPYQSPTRVYALEVCNSLPIYEMFLDQI